MNSSHARPWHSRGILLLRIWAALLVLTQVGQAVITIDYPRCEYLTEPRGIDTIVPRLSWVIQSLERGEKQTAYQIVVSSSPALLAQDRGDLWDTGKVVGDQTNQIAYNGAKLTSRAECWWKVRSWDKSDKPSAWSKPASWTIGLLQVSDWSAKWIDASPRQQPSPGAPLPVITEAAYESIDGAGALDVTSQLKTLASEKGFALEVRNEMFGPDPAYGHVKQLRVQYEISGTKAFRIFAERSWLNYPTDLPLPPSITRATYQTESGDASLDVTKKLRARADGGRFSLNVNNDTMGEDPALKRKKFLRIEYVTNGQSGTKIVAENAIFNYPADLTGLRSVPQLRRVFTISKPIAKATVYATALGVYEMRINGQRVGDHVLAPEWTDFSKRLRYQEYDVTSLVATGTNAIGAQVADGWYSGHIGNGGYQRWGKSPALFAQLELTYKDGSTERVITDSKWKTGVGALLSTDFMLGENYDARKELAGWDKPDFNDSDWLPAIEREETNREMNGQVMEPVRELMEIKAKALTEPAPGKWTYDLGQNMVGVVRLKITAPSGTKITLRHGEMLNPDGTIYTANLRGAPSIDTYICKGSGEETWQPKFTFHGFRYVELTGTTTKPSKEAVTGIVIGTDTQKSGEFTCSDGMINQLQSNIQWGQRGNYLSVPTDCPQRDERLGWMGDAQVFVRTAAYNSDVAAFFTKWLVDVSDSQNADGRFDDVAPFAGPSSGTPAWGDAGVICPWTIYQAYGDLRLLERQYPSMAKWVDYCNTVSSYGIRTGNRGNDYGDWLSIGADTSKELIGTAYYAYSAKLVAQAAMALGRTTEAQQYEAQFQTIRRAFIEKYVLPDGHLTSSTQTAYLMALKFDLLPTALRENAANYLEQDIIAKDYHLSTGFLGVSYLLPELTKAGKVDTAYRLLMQDTFPSWLFSVKNGATTIWERWDGWTPNKGFQDIGMNSFNHYSLGSCGEWLYESVGGINTDPATPGFKQIVIRPNPGNKLTEASAQLQSIHGLITSAWSSANGNFVLTTTIPANTTATVYLPAKDEKNITESGNPVAEAEGVRFMRMENGNAVFAVESGRYQFSSNGGLLSGTDKISRPPVAGLKVPLTTLLANDGEGWTFRSVSPLSIMGATLTVRDGNIHYTPQAGNNGADLFTYTVTDSNGGIATRTVQIAAADKSTAQQAPSP